MATDNRARITQIQNELDALEARAKELQRITELTEGRFATIKQNSTDTSVIKDEVTSMKASVGAILADVQLKQTQIEEHQSSIEDLVTEAEESKETFEEHSKNLTAIEVKIKEFEKAITEQLGRAGAGALAIAFSLRQEEIEKELKRWRGILYYSVGALLLLSVIFFIYSFFITALTLGFFLKISISLPFIYVVWFASKQYSKERFILERYAFKTAQAKSLNAFSKTVKEMDQTEDGQSRAQEFVITSIGKIFVAPKLQGEDPEFPLMKSVDAVKEISKVK
jgi:hypothetical protein